MTPRTFATLAEPAPRKVEVTTMRQALWIFRKDLRRFWPVLALLIPLETWTRWAYPTPLSGFSLIGELGLLAGCFLLVSLIHEEAVPGHRQYWLARPISWVAVLSAKALFILLFVNLPIFLTDAAGLASHRLSIFSFIPSLLACQFFLASSIVFTVAIAAVTVNLAQFAWYWLALTIGENFLAIWLSDHLAYGFDWGNVEWVRAVVRALLGLGICGTILLYQYARRDTRTSRRILIGALAIRICAMWMPSWHAGFTLQSLIGPRHPGASAIRISFDPARAPDTQPSGAGYMSDHTIGTFIPIRITGIPEGMELYSDRSRVRLTASDGSKWSSGWRVDQKLVRVYGRIDLLEEERLLASREGAWQYLKIDSSFWSRGRKLARIQIAWAMTLFSQPEITSLGDNLGLRSVPGGGYCTGQGATSMQCVWPGQPPQWNSVRLPASGGFDTVFTLYPWNSGRPVGSYGPVVTSPVGSYGPFPTDVYLWHDMISGAFRKLPQPPAELFLFSHRAVAHFERELDIPVTASIDPRYLP